MWSSSRSSSSSSSSHSPFSPRLKTMEEVWKDINLSSLQDHTTNYSKDHQHHLHDHNHQGANFGGMILQDFLARPFANESSAAAASPVSATTMLNLNSVPELHFFDNPLRQNSILHQPNAYLNELETEVAHLVEENARLKKQQQQLLLAAAIQVPKKNSLHRTSTAPF
ncbi:hypothetical protein MTR67_009976 [Solanum verrucosum]|uniref:Uncharacterized protein n=1 Tax=Solanum verrucosum TaxID=315347 RepID=A0AAF0Q4B0_SOLVR|nr:hypothetical protein MTR67_009976 [Solanum verrucosum]